MTHKITVDGAKCIGCGACVVACPDSFEMKDGKAYVIKAEIEKLTCEKDAASGCPVGAITVD